MSPTINVIHNTEAIILRTRPYQETSLIVTFYTKELGKINGLAKGVKRPKFRYGSIFQPFSLNQLIFYERKESDLGTIAQCDLKDSFEAIRADLVKTTYASYLSELTEAVTQLNDRNKTLFHLLVFILTLLQESAKEDIEGLIIIFEIKLLGLAGLMPFLNNCAACNKKIHHTARFSLSLGGVVCPDCFHRDPKAQPISKGAAATIMYLQKSSLKDALRLKFTLKTTKELSRILRSFIEFQLEKPLKSLSFLEAIK